MQVLDFAKYLLNLNPETNAARLSLYHYLKNLEAPNAPLTSKTFERFYRSALQHKHWQENNKELAREVKALIESFLSASNHKPFSGLTHADEMQIVKIAYPKDLYEIVKSYMNRIRLEGETVRVLPDRDDGMVALVLKPTQEIAIHYFDTLCVIHGGNIEPLKNDLVVNYGKDLEPLGGKTQMIGIQEGIVGRFLYSNGNISGRILKGYVFQKAEEFHEQPLTQFPAIFYPLKRLERFFVNRATDPLYLELTHMLDQAVILMRENHVDSIPMGSYALDRGQNALKFIFPDDKLIPVLLRELTDLLVERTSGIKSWQKNETTN